MSDLNQASEASAQAPQPRIFKIGANRIVEDASTTTLDKEAIRSFLKAVYPEVANALIREHMLEDGTLVVEDRAAGKTMTLAASRPL